MLHTVPSTVEYIRGELAKVIVGQDEVIEQVLVALLAEGHALIEGVPGTAKTLMVKTLARIVGADFSRIQFTPDLMPSDITGTNVFNTATAAFTLRRGPVFTDILLADEINRTPPKTQAALLEAMEERQVTIDGESQPLVAALHRLRHREPHRVRGHLPSARGAARPLPPQNPHRLPRRAKRRRASSATGTRASTRAASNRWTCARSKTRRPSRTAAPRSARRGWRTACAPTSSRSCGARASTPRLRTAQPRAPRSRCCCARRRSPRCGAAPSPRPTTCATSRAPSCATASVLRAEAELDGATPDSVITDILGTVEVPR